jgi:hypothetical protein
VNRARTVAAVLAALALAAPTAAAGEPTARPAADLSLPYTCGGYPFPLSALKRPANAHKARTSPAKALRREIRRGGWLAIPKRKWRLLVQRKRWVEFASGKAGKNLVWISFSWEKGRWDREQSSWYCEPAAYSEGLNQALWGIDRTQPPAPEATAFTAWVTEQECASGETPAGRIVEPRIRYGSAEVVVTFWVRPREENFATCQGNPAAPYPVKLAEPLGARRLVDGGTFPFVQRHPLVKKPRR